MCVFVKAMKTFGGMHAQPHTYLTSVLAAGEGSNGHITSSAVVTLGSDHQ
jgi:hypothetical protein